MGWIYLTLVFVAAFTLSSALGSLLGLITTLVIVAVSVLVLSALSTHVGHPDDAHALERKPR